MVPVVASPRIFFSVSLNLIYFASHRLRVDCLDTRKRCQNVGSVGHRRSAMDDNPLKTGPTGLFRPCRTPQPPTTPAGRGRAWEKRVGVMRGSGGPRRAGRTSQPTTYPSQAGRPTAESTFPSAPRRDRPRGRRSSVRPWPCLRWERGAATCLGRRSP